MTFVSSSTNDANDEQMGHYDLPTMLGYVSRVTKSRDAREPGEGMVYIGHSMGTTAFWVMCNEYGAH